MKNRAYPQESASVSAPPAGAIGSVSHQPSSVDTVVSHSSPAAEYSADTKKAYTRKFAKDFWEYANTDRLILSPLTLSLMLMFTDLSPAQKSRMELWGMPGMLFATIIWITKISYMYPLGERTEILKLCIPSPKRFVRLLRKPYTTWSGKDRAGLLLPLLTLAILSLVIGILWKINNR